MPGSSGKPAMQPMPDMELSVGYSIRSIVLFKADCWSVSVGPGAMEFSVSLMILLLSLKIVVLL